MNPSFPSYPQPFSQPGQAIQQAQQPPQFSQQQFPNGQPFAPPQQFNGQSGPGFVPNQFGQPQFPNGPPQFQNGPSQPFTSASSPAPYPQSQFQPPRIQSPQNNFIQPRAPASLSPAPGLPQRPSFGAPPVNAFQMQQMHQGQIPGPPNPPERNGIPPKPQMSSLGAAAENPTSLDDLVSGAAREADKADAAAPGKSNAKAEDAQEEKKGKKDKDKDKSIKLVYSDNEVSPEEKMAHLPRYAFVPEGKEASA